MKKQPKAPPARPEDPLKHRALASLQMMKDELAAKEKEQAAAKKAAEKKAAEKKHEPPRVKQEVGVAVSTGKLDVWRPNLEKELFSVAMSGVVPLEKDTRRTDAPTRKPTLSRDAASKMRRAHAEGDVPMAVKWLDDGTCEAARAGKSFALEALGRFAQPEETLDLHGAEVNAVHGLVTEFVRSRRAQGKHVVAIVHGQGKHAPDGQSLLRDVVVRSLSEPPASREIDALRSGEPTRGGMGVLLIALRARG